MTAAQTLTGGAIISAIKSAGIRHILSVPDISTSDGLLFPISRDKDFALTRVCKEDETIGIAAAMSYCGERALALFQHTGFLDSVNAVRAVAVEYRLPVIMMIGLLNKEPQTPARESAVYGVRIMEPILEAMGVDYVTIDTDADVASISPAIVSAYQASSPLAFLLGRSPVAS